jgi:hypothetical protein
MAKRTAKTGQNAKQRTRTVDAATPQPKTKKPVKPVAKATASKTSKMQKMGPRRPATPLERAQRLIDKAMASNDPELQIELSQEALEVSADCADAYTMLSRFLADRRQALTLQEEGLRAAERAIGAEKLESLVGKFWRTPETRPYMRARLALAECQWSLGLRSDATAHLAALLKLNPADDQGIRYALAARLLELNQDAQLDDLLEQHAETTAFMQFTKLLREFRRSGDAPSTHKLLNQAIRSNGHVVSLLLRNASLPDELPDSYSSGSLNEAAMYVGNLAHAWRQTPGAISWLRKTTHQTTGRGARPTVGPTAAVKKLLAGIPQRTGTVWQVCINRLPTWLQDGGNMIRPWAILVVDHTAHKILHQELFPVEPDTETLFDSLARAIQKPSFGKPHRPGEIQLRVEPTWAALTPELQAIDVDCLLFPELDEADHIQAEMYEAMLPEQPPALMEVENFQVSRGASFYGAAADYFRRTPWQFAPSDAVIRIDSLQLAEFESPRWFAVVMGQAGQTYGLALYSSLCDIQSITGGCCSAEESPLEGTAISMIFGEAWEVPINDMLAAEEHRWPLAGPEAYPLVLCTEVAMDARHIQPWELQLLEACVRAIPDFVQQHPFVKGAAAPVPYSAANMKFNLSWVEPEFGGCGTECGECDHDHDL